MSRQLSEVFLNAARGEPTGGGAAAAAVPLRLSLLDLLRLHGEDSACAVLLVLALLCVLPIAGIGSVLGLGILALAVRWHDAGGRGRLSPRLAGVVLSEAWSRRCLHALAWLYRFADRLLRTRWTALCHQMASRWWGGWIALMAFLILLPLPLGNVLPAASLVLFSLGWMFRDGVALAFSALAGIGALAFAILMGDLLVTGAMHGWQWVTGLV